MSGFIEFGDVRMTPEQENQLRENEECSCSYEYYNPSYLWEDQTPEEDIGLMFNIDLSTIEVPISGMYDCFDGNRSYYEMDELSNDGSYVDEDLDPDEEFNDDDEIVWYRHPTLGLTDETMLEVSKRVRERSPTVDNSDEPDIKIRAIEEKMVSEFSVSDPSRNGKFLHRA
jgi:hypothetical protein